MHKQTQVWRLLAESRRRTHSSPEAKANDRRAKIRPVWLKIWVSVLGPILLGLVYSKGAPALAYICMHARRGLWDHHTRTKSHAHIHLHKSVTDLWLPWWSFAAYENTCTNRPWYGRESMQAHARCVRALSSQRHAYLDQIRQMLWVFARDHCRAFQLLERLLRHWQTAVDDGIECGPEGRGRMCTWLGFTDRLDLRQHELHWLRVIVGTQGNWDAQIDNSRFRGT